MVDKILFLDVDGVLNSAEWFANNADKGMCQLDPDAVRRLKRVLRATGAKIVLSSTWRLADEFIDKLRTSGLFILSITPRIASNNRGEEIRAWLTSHVEIGTFAIVDDDADAGDCGLRSRLVHTTWERGMLDVHADALIALLGEAK